VLAQSQTDKDLVELVYGSLVSIDPTGQVVNELAESITVSEDQKEYIVTLSQDAYFHDGEKITATDVVFTIEKIQDAIIQSPERAKWSGVAVEEIAEYEILFNLDQAYPLFLQNLELGILPEHIWAEISVEEFPFSTQNIQPIGSGPFKVAHVTRNEKEVITNYELTASRNSLLSPFLDSVNIHILKTPQEQVALYTNNLVDAVAGINPSQIDKLNLEETTIKSHVLPRVFSDTLEPSIVLFLLPHHTHLHMNQQTNHLANDWNQPVHFSTETLGLLVKTEACGQRKLRIKTSTLFSLYMHQTLMI